MKRTVTQKMQEANRQNAQKSTGPKTPEGKQRSAKNSVRHGILARPIFIENDENEDPVEFESLLTALYDDHKPQGGHEVVLVQRIAAGYWRLRRAYRYETGCIQNNRSENADVDPNEFILPNPQQLDLLIRYEGMIDRELHRTTAQLHRLQAERRQREQQKRIDEAEQNEAELTRLLPDPMTLLQNLSQFTTNPNPLNPACTKTSTPKQKAPQPNEPVEPHSAIRNPKSEMEPPTTKRTRDASHTNSAIRNPKSAIEKAPQPNEPVPIVSTAPDPVLAHSD